ncbi:PGPGW domain-containing protein [Kordiimonas marina]|uniref:PGPGW domain-containing protein n=1 Tax=Kordiimonas marina TaxID=2872312 RepID=UPI001FF2813F|nr:hypothetical protein [Kordiimonas marina]MCJ9427664.1 hypothetical protein [Kordiimonas marina]
MRRYRHILRWLALPVGALMLVLGAITLPLPIPTGLLLIAAGLGVIAFNPLILRWIKRTRKRFPHANHKIRQVTPHLPGFLKRILTRTDTRPR